ncbi:MAG TPA: hypothetical protein VNU44_14480 [Bryobacteraceae bacterium]|jgi:hypothetical protein|nr:hypothetical protein [Bryobacteraceae bacterium]
MASDETKSGAEHVLAHGTARTRAAAGARHSGTDGKRKVVTTHGPSHGAQGKAGKRIKRMVIEPADDGSHVIRHEHHQPDGEMGMAGPRHEDETYTAPDTEALKQHIEEHLGGGGGAEEAPAEEEAAEAGGGSGGTAA